VIDGGEAILAAPVLGPDTSGDGWPDLWLHNYSFLGPASGFVSPP